MPFLLLAAASLPAHDDMARYDHSRITPLSDFRMMGEVELRTQKDSAAPVSYRTLNHEGGMSVRVVDVVGRGENAGKAGLWLYVMTTAPLWAESGEWLEAYRKFLIFLPDDAPIYDFEE